MNNCLRLFCLILLFYSFNSSVVLADIKNVPSQFSTIQAAIDSSIAGDTVLVEPGVYHERINILSKDISLLSYYVLTYDPVYISNTIIDGDGGGIVVNISSSTICLNGFTIMNGNAESGGGISSNLVSAVMLNCIIANNNSQHLGGGLYFIQSSISIDSLTIINNTSGLYGGGIDFVSCPLALVSNTVIVNNHSNAGGGIFSAGSSPQILNTKFYGNSAVESGGAFTSSNDENPGTIIFTGCLVDSNNAGVSGGGFFLNKCSAVLDNLTFSKNTSTVYGGGICFFACTSTSVSNTIFTDNQSNEGGGIFNAKSAPLIRNTNFYRNSSVGSGGAFSSFNEEGNYGTIEITQCVIDGNSAGLSGGGLYFNSSSVSLDSLNIANNISGEYGGGISFFASSSLISNTQIISNHSYEGGGIFNARSIPQIRTTKFYGNSAEGPGGAFASQNQGGYGPIAITSCIIDSNNSGIAGGGLVFNESAFSVTNSLITRNNSSNGGGLYVFKSGPSALINNSILFNSANNGGALVDSNFANNTLIFNSILWGNSPGEVYPAGAPTAIYYTDIAGGWEGVGNLSVDPKLDTTTFGLLTESPCIGAGTDSLSFNDLAYLIPNTDLLGNPRPSPAGTRPDMGAIEEITVIPVPTTFQLSVNVSDNWNIVSVPGLLPTNQNVTSWWSGKDPSSSVFLFEGGYQSTTTVEPGKGYWMKHVGSNTYNTGEEWPSSGILLTAHNPINVASGWNLIGGYEETVEAALLTTTPAGLIYGSLFKYSEGYTTADYLVPGQGYWIYLTGAGQINIPSVTSHSIRTFTASSTKNFGKIIITDNAKKSCTLYSANGEVDLNKYLLPPTPPQGVFDVRYSSQRYTERLSSSPGTIEMNGVQYPVKIKAEGTFIKLSDETGKEIARLKSGEEITLNQAANKLMVSENTIPSVYALEQNYPNPFNPGTTIKFSLPEDAQNVKLIIYNPLGEKVAELVNTALQAGNYNYSWNASNASSGLYIYQLVTEKFVSTKKMVLIK